SRLNGARQERRYGQYPRIVERGQEASSDCCPTGIDDCGSQCGIGISRWHTKGLPVPVQFQQAFRRLCWENRGWRSFSYLFVSFGPKVLGDMTFDGAACM